MFEKEASGLNLLKEKTSFTIPDVLLTGTTDSASFILLSFIESTERKHTFWEDFGRKLATMHKQSHDFFGLDHNNYIGTLQQENARTLSGCDFYTQHRILAQTRLAFDSGRIGHSFLQKIEILCGKMHTYLLDEDPALLHGDLWAGNFLVDDSGYAALIDPAVYYGYREIDLSMMHLFGGFDETLFEAYNEMFPLQKNWKDRIPLFQLYPILVHVNLFGGGYVRQALSIIQKYT